MLGVELCFQPFVSPALLAAKPGSETSVDQIKGQELENKQTKTVQPTAVQCRLFFPCRKDKKDFLTP